MGDSFLISLFPVGAKAGTPSLFVRMKQEKNGQVIRMYQLYEQNGITPFKGTVRDLAITAVGPGYIWTGDDSVDAYVPLRVHVFATLAQL